MFGRTKDFEDIDERSQDGEFFGDEAAAAEVVRLDGLHDRVTQVEQQLSSQFTSLAAYAQIAQEQVELVRSEAKHANERSEARMTDLVERERSDRLGTSPDGVADGVTARLDALDSQISELREGLAQCLSNQKALADAITDLFSIETSAMAPAPSGSPSPAAPPAPFSPAAVDPFDTAPATQGSPIEPIHAPAVGLVDGPIDALSLA